MTLVPKIYMDVSSAGNIGDILYPVGSPLLRYNVCDGVSERTLGIT
jgi:hypothetical protein